MPRSASVLRAPKPRLSDAPEFMWDSRCAWLLAGYPKRVSMRALKLEAKAAGVPIQRWGKSKLFWAEGHAEAVDSLKAFVVHYSVAMARIGTPKITKVGEALWLYRLYTKEDVYGQM